MSRTAPSHRADAVAVDEQVLRAHPLPPVPAQTTKHERGTVVVVAGSRETIGATVLAGTAALRAGAGRLRLLVHDDVAVPLGIAFPEARVTGLALDGAPSPRTFEPCREQVRGADVVILGPGTLDAHLAAALVRAVARHLGDTTVMVLDAGAVAAIHGEPALPAGVRDRVVAMPNATEAARVLDVDPAVTAADPRRLLDTLVERLGVCVAMRDAVTWIGLPHGERFVDRSGHAALATSGSGDVLAGVLAGLLARGTERLAATLWAVHGHGRAGERLARRAGGIGLIARDLVAEIPRVLNDLAS
jgi:hydroxyethylthiazole kinase-like uncharacterized protein yjeF